MRTTSPTLTVAVMTRDGAEFLPRLLDEVAHYADELVIGVDAGSTDGTWDLAREHADRCFRFRHDGIPSPARMACLERASGDWILFLDDDEGMDEAFPSIRDDLLGARDFAGWYLPRKWLDSVAPPMFLCTEPWWPNLALRLVRRDGSRVWKPLAVHSDLRVVGRCGVEPRTSILHYERVSRPPGERAAKLARYRERGQDATGDRMYEDAPPGALAPVQPGALPRTRRHPPRIRVEEEIDDLTARPTAPGWAAEVRATVPAIAAPGTAFHVLAQARNDGRLRWEPTGPGIWPDLALGYRMRRVDAPDQLCPEGRARVGQDVPPGATGHFLCAVHVPPVPGEYELAWQMVSEGEYWFDTLGSAPLITRLRVGD